MQRFLISGGQFGNRCRVMPVYALLRAAILDFRPRFANHCSTIVVAVENSSACNSRRRNGLPHPILFFVAAKENGPPVAAVAATRSASDSNLRCRKGECPACYGRRRNEVRVRFYSSLRQRRIVSLAAAVAATRSASDSILRCRKEEWFRLQ